jgi:uncharacterized membrane protein
MEGNDLKLERTVFFCDAVVAIAITLLALDIKVEHTANGHLAFFDLLSQWKTFAAFFLSFINIANFWKTHHVFFTHIKKVNNKLLWYNIFWLFFIVLLPFSTSLLSNYFFDTPAIFTYSLNTLLISVFQNLIWDYASDEPNLLKTETESKQLDFRMRLYCNLDMINAIIAIIVSFFSPILAFVLLFIKLPMIIIVSIFYRNKIRELKTDLKKGSR